MANNVSISAGTGTSVATDQVGTDHVQLVKLVDGTEDSAARIPGDATNGLDVDVTRIIPGAGATNLGKAEDAPHASGDVGTMALGVRNSGGAVLTSADGDYSPIGVTNKGWVGIAATGSTVSDGDASGAVKLSDFVGNDRFLAIAPVLSNGATADLQRSNVNGTALASAARTASVNSADLINHNGRGLHLVIDVTAITGAPSITVTIQGKDALSGKYYTILAGAAITAVGTTILRVYPGLLAAANLVANDVLPRSFRVSVVNANADSITYSVGSSTIL